MDFRILSEGWVASKFRFLVSPIDFRNPISHCIRYNTCFSMGFVFINWLLELHPCQSPLSMGGGVMRRKIWRHQTVFGIPEILVLVQVQLLNNAYMFFHTTNKILENISNLNLSPTMFNQTPQYLLNTLKLYLHFTWKNLTFVENSWRW